MDKEVVILKPAELILKSKGVRKEFEKRLLFNIKDCLKKNEIEFDHIIRGRARYFIYTPEAEEVLEKLQTIFGVTSLFSAMQVGSKIEAIKLCFEDLAEELNINSKSTFGIRAQVVGDFPMSSRELEIDIGAHIQKKTKAKVNLTKPKHWLRIEIVNKKSFIYTEAIQGIGGLPLGTSGKAIALISEKKQDILASWMIMRRGCEIIPIHIRKNQSDLSKFQNNVKLLEKFAWGSRIKPLSIKEENIKEELKELIKKTKAKAYIFANTEVHPREADMPIFEPLIGLDKKQLKELENVIF
jgi:tRNA uracil 4-sulfurtransferase